MRVVIAEDAVLTRRGIAAVLEDAGHEVVGEVGDARQVPAVVAGTDPDLVVLDIRLPPTFTDEGLVLAAELRQRHPSTAVLVLSQYVELAYALRLLGEHPHRCGYLLKDRIVDDTQLVEAIGRLHRGECVVDPAIVQRVVSRRRHSGPLDTLTARETDVLKLLAEGRSNAAIAALLQIAVRTVETHTAQVFVKLNIDEDPHSNRRVLAVLAYLRWLADSAGEQ